MISIEKEIHIETSDIVRDFANAKARKVDCHILKPWFLRKIII